MSSGELAANPTPPFLQGGGVRKTQPRRNCSPQTLPRCQGLTPVIPLTSLCSNCPSLGSQEGDCIWPEQNR